MSKRFPLRSSTASTASVREKRSGGSSRSTRHNRCGGSTSASGRLTGIDEGSCSRHDIACASSRERFCGGLIVQLRVHPHEPGPADTSAPPRPDRSKQRQTPRGAVSQVEGHALNGCFQYQRQVDSCKITPLWPVSVSPNLRQPIKDEHQSDQCRSSGQARKPECFRQNYTENGIVLAFHGRV